MIVVMRHFSKGIAPDSLDDYTQMGATTIYFYAKKFMDAIIWIYDGRYMRQPTTQDTESILAENEARGFPGMAVASYDRWICHFYFGLGGQKNDLNVLLTSGLFDRQINGVAPYCHYQINGRNYDKGYYLGDEAYPMYGSMVQAYKPTANNREYIFN
ncbi:uncharacterized protein LOC113279235 [Papaver somniferum]|uniref:uncharacterized protein LOC113279235 n=1 Tax=Papaver somniferum TaxID=3469 RepID=UPI000E703F15|nr:uncharacterized protein LOC113279235 [Papaver somniferum]